MLSIQTLLPGVCAKPTAAIPDAAEGEPTAERIGAECEHTAPPVQPRSSPLMGDLFVPNVAHVEDMELECDECHHETIAVPLDSPHESYFDDLWVDCGSCHHESSSADLEPRSCYECHDTKLRDIADERLSAKVILHKNCWACHEVETGLEATESCELCHSR